MVLMKSSTLYDGRTIYESNYKYNHRESTRLNSIRTTRRYGNTKYTEDNNKLTKWSTAIWVASHLRFFSNHSRLFDGCGCTQYGSDWYRTKQCHTLTRYLIDLIHSVLNSFFIYFTIRLYFIYYLFEVYYLCLVFWFPNKLKFYACRDRV